MTRQGNLNRVDETASNIQLRGRLRHAFLATSLLLLQGVCVLVVPATALAASGPIATYSFDETTGKTLTDRSGNNHPGTLTNGPAWSSGKYSGGLVFDGVNDYVTMGDVAQADGQTQFTVSAWVKFGITGGGTGETQLVDKSGCNGYLNDGPWELGVAMSKSHKAEFAIYPQGGSPAAILFSGASTTSVDDANWHYITGRYDGAALSIWVDGVQQNSRAASGVRMPNTSHKVELGGRCNGYPYPFKGTLDDVRLYNRALTQGEIQADMMTPVGGTSAADTTQPTVSITAPIQNASVSGTIAVSANGSDNNAVTGVQFLLDGTILGTEDTLAPYTINWTTTSTTNGAHTLSAIARDAAGNTKTSTAVNVVVSNGNAAPSAPSNLVLSSVSSSTASLSWGASTDDTGVTGYRIFRDNIQVGTSTSLTFTNTGLTANTTYTYFVVAFDAAGNVSSRSNDVVVNTSALPGADTTPPSVPSGLNASGVTATQATISWSPSIDNVGVAGYKIFRNGTQAGTVTTNSFVNGGLAPNTLYSYTVSAYDAAGNSSLESAALSVTTTANSTGSYSTGFDLTENPISEGGAWAQGGKTTGLDWTDVRTSGSIAYGTQTGSGGYDDSISLLSGFGPNQRISGVIQFTGSRSNSTDSHEVELILRGSYSAHTQHLYECNIGYSGASGWYMQIMRQYGVNGDYTEITSNVRSIPEIHNGDTFTAEVIGNVINSYINGVKIRTATDSTIRTGQPGIGFFWRGTEKVSDFAFSSITVTELP